jgi:hypothetical protein
MSFALRRRAILAYPGNRELQRRWLKARADVDARANPRWAKLVPMVLESARESPFAARTLREAGLPDKKVAA